jgi:methylmalonyl-CoA mutase N-terminal domain/subunit
MTVPTGHKADFEARVAAWQEAVERSGIDPAETESGIPVAAAYTPLDLEDHDPFEQEGLPGEFPYTRGIHPTMYRGRLWTMRLYSGWGTPEDTNERFRYLLERGQTGLSVALDLPSQMGLDSDHPLARPEVGKVGVAVDSLADMEQIFDGIPLTKISTSFTINATAPILLAMYQAVGEQQGVDRTELRGTVQNDILKEYLARKTYIYPPAPSLRLVTDVIEYATRHLPKFNPISVCGYHMRQAGCDAVQEIAMSLSNAAAYVQAVVDRGVDVDDFAPRFSFNLSTMRDFFEEVAKHRAARRIWARLMRDRFGANDPRSYTLRLFSGGDGTSLTAAEPFNNVVRIAYQALAIVLGGAQAIHTIAWDEALGLPSEESSLLALRTQQIIAHETGVARTADPLGGSYYIESLTDELYSRATRLMAQIEEHGGVIQGIEDGSLEHAIAESAYRQQQRIDSGELPIVGVNQLVEESTAKGEIEPFTVGADIGERQLGRLERVRAERDDEAVSSSLDALRAAARGEDNLMPAIVAAVRTYATVGEISGALSDVFGNHQPERAL